MLAIFVATVLGLIAQPMPLAAVALTGLTFTMITGVLEPAVALSGFAEPTIWLIVAAFFISIAVTKTGLGRRVALWFVAMLGRRSLGLGYGLALTDLILAPATPSNTARSGGVIYPIIACPVRQRLRHAGRVVAQRRDRRRGQPRRVDGRRRALVQDPRLLVTAHARAHEAAESVKPNRIHLLSGIALFRGIEGGFRGG